MSCTVAPPAVRSFRRRFGLALAATTIMPHSVASAETPIDTPPIESPPRNKPFQSSYQTWIGFTAAGPIADQVLTFVDLGSGFYSDMHPAAFYVRPALGVRLPLGFSVFAGYTYTSFWSEEHERGEEHTVFEQAFFTAPITEVDLFARLRVEERIRAESDTAVRLRTMAQINVPLWRRASLQIVLLDELFLGLNQTDYQPEVLDMNQLFVGLGWQPDRHFRVEGGYLGILVPRRAATALVHSSSLTLYALW